MLSISLQNLGWLEWLLVLLSAGSLLVRSSRPEANIDPMFISTSIYNLFLHPLAHVPGPLWGRATGIPSWYHAVRGDRHLWLWQHFKTYGSKIRPEPDLVLFCDTDAYTDIYGMKANVRRSDFYTAMKSNYHENNTLTTTDVERHAKRRKILNIAFSEKMVRAASTFVIKHVDCWNQLLLEENGSTTDWSAPVDLSHKLDTLTFDIMGDLSFGKSFDIKEAKDNPLREVPQFISKYMLFYYPMCRSPFMKLLLWMKPRGLDRLLARLTPPPVQKYQQFVSENIASRMALQREQAKQPEEKRRQDIFYFLCDAQDPATGLSAFNEGELRAESNLFIVAGADTVATSLIGVFFYITGDSQRYQKLVDEILTTFESVEDIVHGPKLLGCKYLRACLDEGMRLTPPGPCELPREVLPGGIQIKGEYYPAGTIVGTVPWVLSRNQDVYGDAEVFRPERWIVDEPAGVTEEEVRKIKVNFHPFSRGPGSCVGKNLARMEMLIMIARTIFRLDIRRAPGSTLGGGSPEFGWGARDTAQLHVKDAYISIRKGPEVQFRKRLLVPETKLLDSLVPVPE